ncbi:CBS domain-containing protein [Azonexus sp.]|jgi:CBS domain-containing protein|uniref:CBS domain-containing protein n=1 Tax=Azonexus sp. TaxID=1872668 RepID=UPI00282ECBEF|nr:CBS domain-containing protein [Azonexus sp.]MDR1995459.1 CBS domain-containing protein [Azonexus sp.]
MPNRPVSKVIQDRYFLVSTPEKSVYAVAALMKQSGTTAVLVVNGDNGVLRGILTERDVVFRVVADSLDPKATPVGTVMTREPQSIGPDKPFGHALHLMFEGGFRHMPVVDAAGRPIGLLSARDALGLEVLRFCEELEQRDNLAQIL